MLHQLHVLMRDNMDDERGDSLRDEMDGPWYAMSDVEQARVRGMSADLKSLESECPFQHANQSNYLEQSFGEELEAARAQGDWQLVLKLLRMKSANISWDLAATMRGDAYSKLGDHSTARLFYVEAKKLSPGNAAVANALRIEEALCPPHATI